TPIPHNPPQPPIPPGQYGMLPPPAPGVPGPRPHMPSQFQRARPRTGLWRSLGLVLFVGVIGFNLLLFLGMFGAVGMLGGGQRDPHGVHETTRESGTSSKIAVIPVDGVIMEGGQGGLFGGAGVDPVSLVEDGLRRARNDDKVVAVILQVNSPGGGVTASDYIHDAIKRFRADTGKPVVVFMKDLAASGGYYVAAPADYIVASPTTLTGSIGVIIQGFNFHGTLTEIVKGQDATVKAGGNKAMGSMFADPASEDYREGRQLLQQLADEMHGRFKDIVRQGRKSQLKPDWETYADGRILSASQAKNIGLVDEIGYFADARKKAESLAGVDGASVVQYGRLSGLAALFGVAENDPRLAAEVAEKAAPGIAAAGLTARVEEALRLYPGRPMAIWVP
ncbi:MAG: signal peptide peptidase SppA, partial [Planctomycetes bacterium]|nr:signal peptide peptidase SppA [Planctomycetota bacterium]